MNKHIKTWLLFCFVLAATQVVQAQSSKLDNGYRSSAASDTTFEYGETLYIGPGAVWEINGVHVVYSSNIWIAPTAQISGNGTLIIADPSANPFYTGLPVAPTVIDGNNGNFIELNIEHRNPANIILDDIEDPGFGIVNPSGALAAALKVGKDFSFEVGNGYVLLNGHDFVFDGNATISNFGVNRMVVTSNSIAGHMVKQNTGAATFIFPLGIAEGDYTPATITGAGNYHVSVTDYTSGFPIINVPSEGMHRTWHIFGGTATNVVLQHNSPATDGADYVDNLAFISQYQGSGLWSSSATPDYVSTGVHNNGVIGVQIPAADADGAWFTKASDPTPLSGPDLTPSSSITNGTFTISAGTSRNFIASIGEVAGESTSNATHPVYVRISKSTNFEYSFNPSATTLSGTAVHNADWDLISNTATSMIFQLKNTVEIPAYGLSRIGINMQVRPTATAGIVNVQTLIFDESGGETNNTNNITLRQLIIQ